MASDFYVNVSGKKVLYSSLDSNLQKQLASTIDIQAEAERQGIDTTKTYQEQQREFIEKDHIVKDSNGGTVSVPGRYAEVYGIEAPNKAKIQEARQKIKQAKKIERRLEKQKKKYDFLVHGGDEDKKDERKFDELTSAQQKAALKSVSPLGLAKMGILAPSSNIAFRTKKVTKVGRGKGDNVVQMVHSPSLESNYKAFLFTGDTRKLDAYLGEIYEKEGARAAKKAQSELIAQGIKHTSLELARQSGGGTRKQRLAKEKADTTRRRKVESGMKILGTSQPSFTGLVGSTFDERLASDPRILVPTKKSTQTYTLGGKQLSPDDPRIEKRQEGLLQSSVQEITLDGKKQILDPSGKAVIEFGGRTDASSLIAPEVFKQVVKEKGAKLTSQGERLIELYTKQPEQFSFVRKGIISDPKTGEKYNPLTQQGSSKIAQGIKSSEKIQAQTVQTNYDALTQQPPEPPYSTFGKPLSSALKDADKYHSLISGSSPIPTSTSQVLVGAAAEAGKQLLVDAAHIDNLIEQTKGSIKKGEWVLVPNPKGGERLVFKPGEFKSEHKLLEPPKTQTDIVLQGLIEQQLPEEISAKSLDYAKKFGMESYVGAVAPLAIAPWKQTYQGLKLISPIKTLTVPVLSKGESTINLVTKLQLGYKTKRIDLIGKYGEGGKFFKGKGDPLLTPVQKMEGVRPGDSFDVFQASQYNEPQIKELTRISKAFEPQKQIDTASILRSIEKAKDIRSLSKKGRIEYNKLLDPKEWDLSKKPDILEPPKPTSKTIPKTIGESKAEKIITKEPPKPILKNLPIETGRQQRTDLLEQIKGSGVLNKPISIVPKKIKGGLFSKQSSIVTRKQPLDIIKTKVGDIDVSAETDVKKLISQQKFEALDVGKGFGVFKTKTGVTLGKTDPLKPEWIARATPPTNFEKGKFVRGDNLKRIKNLIQKPESILESPRGKLWITPNKEVTRLFSKKATKGLTGEAGKPAKVSVEVDMSKIYRFEKQPLEIQKQLRSKDYLTFQQNLESIARQQGFGGYTKPYHDITAKATKYEVAIFDPKIIKEVKNIPPTKFGMKEGSGITDINIISPSDEVTSAVKGLNVEKVFGKKKLDDSFTQRVIGSREKVEFSGFYKQSESLAEATSGIVSKRSFEGTTKFTPKEIESLLGGYKIRGGIGKAQRAKKDIVRSYFFSDRVLAQAAFRIGDKKLAQKIGLRMGETFKREKDWINWPKSIKELKQDPSKLKLEPLKKQPSKIITSVKDFARSPSVKTSPLTTIKIDLGTGKEKPQTSILKTKITSSKQPKITSPKISLKSSLISSPSKTSLLSSSSPILKTRKINSILSSKSSSSKSPSFKSPSTKSFKSPSVKSSSILSPRSTSALSFKSPSTKSFKSPSTKSFKSPSTKSFKSPSTKSFKSPSTKSFKSPSTKSSILSTSTSTFSTTSKPPPSKPPSSGVTTFFPPAKTPPSKPPTGLAFILGTSKKKRNKKKNAEQEDFFGSTHEGTVWGFRSKKADIVYGSKKVAKIVTKERRLEAKRKIKIRKTTVRKAKLPGSPEPVLMGNSKVKLM